MCIGFPNTLCDESVMYIDELNENIFTRYLSVDSSGTALSLLSMLPG